MQHEHRHGPRVRITPSGSSIGHDPQFTCSPTHHLYIYIYIYISLSVCSPAVARPALGKVQSRNIETRVISIQESTVRWPSGPPVVTLLFTGRPNCTPLNLRIQTSQLRTSHVYYQNRRRTTINNNILLYCALTLAAQCIVIGPVCVFVCGCVCVWLYLWVCYHDNSKLHASIFTKLGL